MLGLVAGGIYAWHRAEQAAAQVQAAAQAQARADAAERQRALDVQQRRGERDCAECPEMLRVSPGGFLMGSAKEGPQHRVTISHPLSLGKYEVTRGEFEAFVRASGYKPPRDAQAPDKATDYWRHPGFDQTDRHPVVNVTWQDADAYVRWLRKVTGKNYRLPSESEWEYAARAGTTTERSWGEGEACRYANVGDLVFAKTLAGIKGDPGLFSCMDGHSFTAPVGSFPANAWGFHDMLGNAQEWVLDCWTADYAGASANGDARQDGDCYRRVLRGGSWSSGRDGIRVTDRVKELIGYTQFFIGFRVARAD